MVSRGGPAKHILLTVIGDSSCMSSPLLASITSRRTTEDTGGPPAFVRWSTLVLESKRLHCEVRNEGSENLVKEGQAGAGRELTGGA